MNFEALVKVEDHVGGHHVDVSQRSLERMVKEVCAGPGRFRERLQSPFTLIDCEGEATRPAGSLREGGALTHRHHFPDHVPHEQFGLTDLQIRAG